MWLSELLGRDRDPRAIVARRWDSERGLDSDLYWSDLLADVAALRDRLLDAPTGPWLLVTEDAYAFAVGLLGLWHTGRSALCPPNQQPGTLGRLQTSAAGVLSDRADWFPHGGHLAPLNRKPVADASAMQVPEWQPIPQDRLALQLFTSGTTGDAKPVSKQLAHLDAEVEELERFFGERIGGAEVFGTASHQHFYGMMFRVLWPIAAGRPFRSNIFLHPRELVPRMRASGTCVLASVPTHLKRMVKQRAASELRDTCIATFSSGGLLPTETALQWKSCVGAAPIEIFGSTETGGVGWRTCGQDRAPHSWAPFPNVTVQRGKDDGRLCVRSPFVSTANSGGSFAMGDRVDCAPDGKFELRGRADRVVKVGEKRLDLARMESALRGHSLVDEVALLLLEQDSEARVAGVVVPSPAGRELLEREGRMMLGRLLADTLAEDWDRVLLPRVWRTVEELPEDEQGKTTTEVLRALFVGAPRHTLAAAGPIVEEESVSQDAIECACLVPSDLSCFPDHFPGLPLVPGVMQLDWAMTLAARLFDGSLDVREIGALKFHSALGPGARFRLRVERTGPATLSFRVWQAGVRQADREFASGRVKVALGDRAS